MPLRQSVWEAVPPVLLALVVNGFWIYLGTLELLGIEPRTAITAAYYGTLGLALTASAWAGRETLLRRLRSPSRLPRAWAAVALALAAWFLLNVALLSSGVTARDAAALLVLSSLPSALLVLALTRPQLRILAAAWVVFAFGLFFVSFVSLLADPTESGRFSPIDELDPITAAHVGALGAIILLIPRFVERRARLAQAAGVALLIALAVMPASRGALVSLLLALVAVLGVLRKRALPLLLPAVVIGFVLGAAGSTVVGADYYYSIDIPGIEGRVAPPSEGEDFTGAETPALAGPPISSLSLRRYLWGKALEDSLDRPLFGHGVGMLVDDSPETMRMVRSGRVEAGVRTHPHNVVIESVYSLGVLGLGLFLGLVTLSAIALIRLWRHAGDRFFPLFALGFGVFVGVNSMVSGEIGSDASVWIALAMPVALQADETP
jgi:hypothetical protein